MKNAALIARLKSTEALTAKEKAELIAPLKNLMNYDLAWKIKNPFDITSFENIFLSYHDPKAKSCQKSTTTSKTNSLMA